MTGRAEQALYVGPWTREPWGRRVGAVEGFEDVAAVVGRVRECPLLDIKLTLLSHNLVRGAAGAALLNAELLAARGFLTARDAASQSADEALASK